MNCGELYLGNKRRAMSARIDLLFSLLEYPLNSTLCAPWAALPISLSMSVI